MALLVPGQRLPAGGVPGAGAYEAAGALHAALVGTAEHDPATGTVSVRPFPETACRAVVPGVAQVVLGTVTKLTARYAAVEIKAIEQPAPLRSVCLPEPFRGTIRLQDILPEDDKEAPQVSLAFAPGDLVRAKVIGVGDTAAGLLLSTGAEPRLGVVFARSAASGEPLVPVSWNAMVCSRTGVRESRKCARPDAA